MLLGYDPIARLDNGSPSGSERRTVLLNSPINEAIARDNLQATTPMGLTAGSLAVQGQVI